MYEEGKEYLKNCVKHCVRIMLKSRKNAMNKVYLQQQKRYGNYRQRITKQ